MTSDPSSQCGAGGDGRLAPERPVAAARPGYLRLLVNSKEKGKKKDNLTPGFEAYQLCDAG